MRIDVVTPAELGEREIERWRELQRLDPAQDNPFLSPEFTLTVGALQPHVRVAVLSEGSTIVGFFPYQRHALGIGRPVGAGLSDLQGMVYDRELDLDARRLLRACGLATWEFDHLQTTQPMFAPYHTSLHPSPVMDLSEGFEAYMAALRAKSPTTVRMTRYKRNRMGREVGPVRSVFESDDTAALRTLLEWKSRQYQRTGRSDRFAHAWIVELVERLHAIRTKDFTGALSLLYAGDELVAGHFGLRSSSQLVTWFPTYNTEFGKYSPGLIQHLSMAEEGAAIGLRAIDMGRGPKSYKESLKTTEYHVAEGRVARFSPVAGADWLLREPPRRLRNFVIAHPALAQRADRVLKGIGRLRTRRGADREERGEH